MDDAAQRSALLEHVRDLLAVVDESGVYRYANDASDRILGIAPTDLVGTAVTEYIHPADRDDIVARFETLVDSEEPTTATAEYRHRTAEGDWVWLESRLSNATVPDLDGYVLSARDVTERKRAQRRERLTQSRLQELAANAEDVLWMFDGDWSELLFLNEAYEDIWGEPVDRLRADPTAFLDGIHPDDRPRVLEAMERISDGEATDLEYRVNADLGYRRWVWVKAQPIEEDGEVTRIVGFARDITDRRRRERQLLVMDNLLRHNVRNDLNVIMGHAELVRAGGDQATAESMSIVLDTATDLLDTARKEREIIDVLVGVDDPAPRDLTAVLDAVVEDVEAAHPTCTVTVDAPAEVEVVALPELRHAIYELIDNAAEHADCDAAVEIEVTVEAQTVRVTVRDNAPPIPGNEYQPQVEGTEPSDLNHGTGLGLWLVYWVVDLSDGEIQFDRRPDDVGNRVILELPRAPA